MAVGGGGGREGGNPYTAIRASHMVTFRSVCVCDRRWLMDTPVQGPNSGLIEAPVPDGYMHGIRDQTGVCMVSPYTGP